jgi:hypothetical protein
MVVSLPGFLVIMIVAAEIPDRQTAAIFLVRHECR